jgi:hypothetical protein
MADADMGFLLINQRMMPRLRLVTVDLIISFSISAISTPNH